MKSAAIRIEGNLHEADVSHASHDEDDLGPAFDFMGTLWALKHALEVTSRRMEAELGLTAPQRMTLRIVGTFPGISATRVAKLLRVHRATITVMVNRLEKRQMVKRHSDLIDRRRVTLTLTPEGRLRSASLENTDFEDEIPF